MPAWYEDDDNTQQLGGNSKNRIAFGSCNDQDLQNNLWPIIASRQPAAFVWGGDSIYAGKWMSQRYLAFRVESLILTNLVNTQISFWNVTGQHFLPNNILNVQLPRDYENFIANKRKYRATDNYSNKTSPFSAPLMVRDLHSAGRMRVTRS